MITVYHENKYIQKMYGLFFFFSSRRRHTRYWRDWSSDVCSSDLVGRPNVGKSTLVNRIVGRREAIVEERPGVTRDRKVLEAEWCGRPFRVVDTGGWLPGATGLDAKVSRQSERAMEQADALLFVVDARIGLTEE